jgi:hypothetical protein
VRKEFIVERQGRAFCLYAGLLDLAHQQGLKSIRTGLVQAPSEANNRVAICSATVVLEQGGVEREFTGLGDAAPNNVAPAMQTCLLRMAETRAKARALRDAVNISVAAFEELGEEDAHDGAPEAGYGTNRPARSTRQAVQPAVQRPGRQVPNATDPATKDQQSAIRSMCDRQKRDAESYVREAAGVDVENLSFGQAADVIRKLSAPVRSAA